MELLGLTSKPDSGRAPGQLILSDDQVVIEPPELSIFKEVRQSVCPGHHTVNGGGNSPPVPDVPGITRVRHPVVLIVPM